ncbi:MAG TPA: NAD(P)H-hydrate dehydratase [Gemmatimonadaceae bacterium]|nr:NAD(P)H-hydrate dehydratase [Gemmatimonadaceae bacterium]
MPRSKKTPVRVTRTSLKRMPLPDHDSNSDKEERGRVLIVGGEVGLPGAVILAGLAALRAGAGKLQLATCARTAPLVAVSVPECLAVGLDETKSGTISSKAAREIADVCKDADAVLIGPGLRQSEENDDLVKSILTRWTGSPVILDAGALSALRDSPDLLHGLGGKAILTPHSGEMANTLGTDKWEVERNPGEIAIEAAAALGAVVALKGPKTFIASPDGELYVYESGDIGLATSGSGDTLAGVVTGLLARGASPLHSAVWGVFLHGAAGNVLAERLGRIGFLARELLDEIPPIMNGL